MDRGGVEFSISHQNRLQKAHRAHELEYIPLKRKFWELFMEGERCAGYMLGIFQNEKRFFTIYDLPLKCICS